MADEQLAQPAERARRYGLIEAGGTKFVLGFASMPASAHATRAVPPLEAITATHRISTTQPGETLAAARLWFASQVADHGPLDAIGIASFGPLELDRASPDWGHVTRTTKPGWDHADLAGPLIVAHQCPVGFDTDVNGAARAESLWGAGAGQRIALYLTIGTGVGGGAMIDGAPLHGLTHPEMGHIRLARHPDDHDFAGICRFHGDCLEGLASGPAIKARWGASLSELGADHPGHTMIAWYLAQACCTFQAIMEPGAIILGGGVMGTPGLLARVREAAVTQGGGYFVGDPRQVIVAPGLGDHAGLLGALALAMDVDG